MSRILTKIINTEDETIQSLHDYLIGNPDYFKDGVTDCHTINDVVYFRILNPERIMFVGDQFLCDIYGGEMWVVELTNKKIYNNIRKQKLEIIPIVKIVKNCGDHFPRYNGYWMIPESFIRRDKV